ncbi:hypothetical protein KIN20_025958 [Parelaphostrongylus tenuis]|uniref:Uncharacterized protein n=1 Tax=Parelaphostrongylus tenuis TaxID=148309 RepID=A0AAD5NB41_PARTN|nr:hypothetical protein KIN20_025958 [Parelaphostrongylus tenuis]
MSGAGISTSADIPDFRSPGPRKKHPNTRSLLTTPSTARGYREEFRHCWDKSFDTSSVSGSPVEDSSPKSIRWQRHSEDLKTPLQGYDRKQRNTVCTTSNVPFGICAGGPHS